MIDRLSFGILVIGATLLFQSALSQTANADDPIGVQRLTYSSPAFASHPTIHFLSKQYKPLWKEALEHAESDLKRQTAIEVAFAHKNGALDFGDFGALLEKALNDDRTPNAHRVDFVRALIVIDAKQCLGSIINWLDSSKDYNQIVEPSLAAMLVSQTKSETNSVTAKLLTSSVTTDRWQKSLGDKFQASWRRTLSARCLAIAKHTECLPALLTQVRDETCPAVVRIECANAVSTIALSQPPLDSELAKEVTELANSLCERPDIVSQSIASRLLESQDAGQVHETLLKLARSSEPVVAFVAWQRLLKLDYKLVMELAENSISHKDSKLRQMVVETLPHDPTTDRIKMLFAILADRHPSVRTLAREKLIELAGRDEDLSGKVRSMAVDHLGVKDGKTTPLGWREVEQSIIVLARLDHESAAPQFLQLLTHSAPEIAIGAAWGLRTLAVKSVLPQMFRRAQLIEERVIASRSDRSMDAQLAHLLEAFGQMKYQPAVDLTWQYARKTLPRMGAPESRAAAAWAIGLHLEGTGDEAASAELIARLTDDDPAVSEFYIVRYASAISLGRVAAKSALPTIRQQVGDGPKNELSMACAWSLSKITGKPIRPAVPRPISRTSMFLQPLPDRTQK
jgi:HEAT repeat protein